MSRHIIVKIFEKLKTNTLENIERETTFSLEGEKQIEMTGIFFILKNSWQYKVAQHCSCIERKELLI